MVCVVVRWGGGATLALFSEPAVSHQCDSLQTFLEFTVCQLMLFHILLVNFDSYIFEVIFHNRYKRCFNLWQIKMGELIENYPQVLGKQ